MAPTTKEAQRAELHKTIWRIANDLRGSVDGWDFKSYVLGMLFYRFISENLAAYINAGEHRAGDVGFDYATLDDASAEFGRAETVAEKGFYIVPSELFATVRNRAPRDQSLNETLARVFKNIEGSALGTASEDDLKGLFDDLDVNSSKLGNTVAKRNEKLVKLLDAIGDLPLGNFEDSSIDLFGDAYEYLMQMYASNAGKSGGEYYTPQEVSELLARITVVGKTEVNKVYDPAVGSGSLLLKFAKVLGAENVRQGFYGQEINLNTYNLARINMFLHDVNYEKFNLAHGDTLIDPAHWDDEPFEAIVSNPPYSIKWDGDANPLLINDPRFAPAGVLAPKSKADLAFTMHMLSWLAVDGTAAIVEFPGVLYRGGAEQKIRSYLVDNNYIDAVIQLPPDLFFGTTIATCIIVLKKSKNDNAVLFIDASAEFVRIGNKNKLTDANQQAILTAFTDRTDAAHFARLVESSEIAENGYNIAVSSYVEREDTSVAVDIVALNAEIARIVARQHELRVSIDAIVADLEGVSMSIDEPTDIVIYQTGDGEFRLPFDRDRETIWASQAQIMELFAIDQSGVSRHIRKVFSDAEVDAESNMQKVHIAGADRPVSLYSLDVILAVGYRANSGRAIGFRRWASGVLKEYLLEGAALNEQRLEQLNSIVRVMSRSTDELVAGVADVISRYLPGLQTLRDYDNGVITPSTGDVPSWTLTYAEAREVIDRVAGEFPDDALFGGERGGALKGVVETIYQGFGGVDLYPTVQQKAANLLYLVVKDHPLSDGNKRSAAALFVHFLARNRVLFYSSGVPRVSNNALAAITLVVAMSDPKEKDLMIALVMRMLDEDAS